MTSSIVYERDAFSVSVLATVGETVFEQADRFGGIQRIESRDFIITRADLVLDGSVALPQTGDTIRETRGTQVFVYKVMSPAGETPFRYGDQYRNSLRIHTKHVATEGV